MLLLKEYRECQTFTVPKHVKKIKMTWQLTLWNINKKDQSQHYAWSYLIKDYLLKSIIKYYH